MGVGVLGAARSEAEQLLYTTTRRSVSCVCLCVAVCVVGLLWFVPRAAKQSACSGCEPPPFENLASCAVGNSGYPLFQSVIISIVF